MNRVTKILATGALVFSGSVFSQHPEHTSGQQTIPIIELPYENPYDVLREKQRQIHSGEENQQISQELLQKVSDIYRMHLMALDAQLSNDLPEAEGYINESLAAMQTLMDDQPEAMGTRLFTEMYRSVMLAYQQFYGMNEPLVDVYGDVFAIQQEMFMNDDWFDDEYFVLPDNLTIKQTDVPLIRNQQVNNHIAYLTVRRPEVMQRWLQRSVYYFPMMKEIFEDEGVPEELIHLAMIESGLVPVARSHAAAVGMWQFIYATGAVYGLERNWWIDERRDPIKSTRAAAQHLRDLYEYWDDWHLALANYNVSTRRMRSSIRNSGGVRNYWEIYPFLPRETRGYVPGFIAATLIAMNYEDFGFEVDYNVETYAFDTVDIEGSIDLSILAEAAGITTEEMRNLNPELLRWATPPGPEPYPLKIPVGTKEEFMANYEQIPDDKRISNMVVHTINRGETLGAIANRYGTTVRDLYATNEGLSHIIHPGQEIVIPVPDNSVAIRSDRPSRSQVARTSAPRQSPSAANRPPNTVAVTYTVKSGDTVGHIAEWFDTQAWRVRSWNNVGNMIRAGQKLTIYVPQQHRGYYASIDNMSVAQKRELERQRGPVALTDSDGTRRYTVQRNDNLSDISRMFGTTVRAIMNANGLSNSTIYVGQSLIIPN